MPVARWEDWSGGGVQHLALTERADAILADGVYLAGDGAFAARYRVRCDAGWRCRALDVELIGDERTLRLRGDGHGGWRDAAGTPLPALAGAIDVDLPITPFTNTLPIRRLRLRPGASAEIAVAYVRVPELTIELDRQRYTCLTPDRYRFDAVDGTFTARLDLDPHALVLNYEGLFRRR